ncbi:MAG: hypothetical protein GX557_15030, partial [Chloroflexi bacterium]|nr:hypothetical protein [Chloroflexota bacterium]
ELTKLYQFDEEMLSSVDALAGAIAAVAQRGETEDPSAEAGALVKLLEELNLTFSHRQDVLIS